MTDTQGPVAHEPDTVAEDQLAEMRQTIQQLRESAMGIDTQAYQGSGTAASDRRPKTAEITDAIDEIAKMTDHLAGRTGAIADTFCGTSADPAKQRRDPATPPAGWFDEVALRLTDVRRHVYRIARNVERLESEAGVPLDSNYSGAGLQANVDY